jgi:hypothetical protein
MIFNEQTRMMGEKSPMNRSAGLQPACDPNQECGTQLKEKVHLAVNAQSRSQTGAPVVTLLRLAPLHPAPGRAPRALMKSWAGWICCLALATGCASHKQEKIVFLDEPEIHAALASADAPVAQPRLEKADELKIERMIFGYLLERHFWDLADYSAVFLQADDAQEKAMIKQYPNHVPPIKMSYRANVQPHKTPMDEDTNKPGMILSTDVNEPNADGSVDAIGRWYAGDAVTGFRAFHFQKVNGEWQIAEVQ